MGIMIQAIYNIADRRQAARIQHKVQKKREQRSKKNFMELIEEELQKELSIEPIREE